ncbi:MAG: MmgE/PrpD family protein [Chloroflexota bacterium]
MQRFSANMKEDVVWTLAKNLVKVRYEDLPMEAVEATRKSALDTLGVILAASGTTPGLKGLVELVKEGGGRKESTVLGFGVKAPAWMAAFANGAMVHCLDYDDIHYYSKGHPSANTVPSAFAVAERLGKVNGKDFITAVALGSDLFSRLSFSVGLQTGWHATALFGVFASAAASGKLLGLNEEQMVDALGLAFCQAAGTQELRFGVGSDIGGMRDAFPNKGGVLAALLAQKGIRGVRTCLEGKAGLYNCYFGGDYDRNALTAELGKRFHGADMGYKAWPACGGTHPYIYTVLGMVSEYDIKPEDVREITVFVGNESQNLCEPLEGRRRPTTSMDAKFSIPFTVGVAVARRKVGIGDYSAAGLKDPAALALAQKVTPKFDADYNVSRAIRPAKIEIITNSGKSYSKRTEFPYGHPKNPVTREDHLNKFRDCVGYAARPVPKENVEKAIALVDRLEEATDVSRVIRLLTPRKQT